MDECPICSAFPDALKAVKRQALKFKNDHMVRASQPGWPDYFFTVFHSLDVPRRDEGSSEDDSEPEDEEEVEGDGALVIEEDPPIIPHFTIDDLGKVTLIPDLEEQEALLGDAAFQKCLHHLRVQRAKGAHELSIDLSTAPLISPVKTPTRESISVDAGRKRPKGKESGRQTHPKNPKRSKLDDDVQITSVMEPPTTTQRVDSMEVMMQAMAANIQKLTDIQAGAASGRSGVAPTHGTIGRAPPTGLGSRRRAEKESSASESEVDEVDDQATTVSALSVSTGDKFTPRERRVNYLDSLRVAAPELAHPSLTDSAPPSVHFGFFMAESSKTVMPFCPMLTTMIKQVGKVKKFKELFKKDPFTQVEKYYPTVEPEESTILQPREISRPLLDEVRKRGEGNMLTNAGASGVEAKIKPNTTEGQQDAAAILQYKRAAAFLRLTNSQELAAQSLQTISQSMNSRLTDILTNPGLSAEVRSQLKTIHGSSHMLDESVNDLLQGNRSLAKCSLHQYVTSVRARQKAWLACTNLPSVLQQEILRTDIPATAPAGVEEEGLPLLGARAVTLIEQNYKSCKKDKFRDFFLQQEAKKGSTSSSGTGSHKRAQKQTKRKGKKNPQPPAQLSAEASAAGWFTAPPNNNSRGRGNARGRGGQRGQGRGFSGPQASKRGH
jgi:hypothetical protein